MATTQNLNLYVLSESDDLLVSEFVEKIAGESSESNFQIIDQSIADLQENQETHTHNYAGSLTPGGAANSALALDVDDIGSDMQPVYFKDGIPVLISTPLGTAAFVSSDTLMNVSSYDSDGAIASAGGIAAWISANYENAEESSY